MQLQSFDLPSQVMDKTKYFYPPSETQMQSLQSFMQNLPMNSMNGMPKMEIPQHHLNQQQNQYQQQQNTPQPITASVVQQQQNEGILSPQKVRTERYVKVSLKGVSVASQKPLYLSWFLDNNGLPDNCLLLIPERHPNVIINFKTTHGWIEVETKSCLAPDFEIQFELKLHHALLNQRRYSQSHQPVVLRFYLLEKREDGMINNLGEVLLSLLLMSSKCPNRTLIAHLVGDEKSAEMFNVPSPSAPTHVPTMHIPQNVCLPLPMAPPPSNDLPQRKLYMQDQMYTKQNNLNNPWQGYPKLD